nr:ATP-binding protein [Beggiatoa leptomitoformis]
MQARDAAEAANRTKSNFLANVSHELRTPLNGILGYTQILQYNEDLNQEQKEGINIIHKSGEYLLTLINDILDLSSAESGNIQLYVTNLYLHDFFKSLTDLFKLRAAQKNIAFLYEPITSLPLVIEADEKRLRQIIINLLGNAIKFTKQGGICLKVGYQQGCLRLQVEDTGIGIAETDFERIFNPFQQVSDAHHKAEGTGLGLSITQRLVALMGGTIQIQSRLAYGTTFDVQLPLPAVYDYAIQQSVIPPATITGYVGEPRHLLIIDDKRENRSVLHNLLAPLGFNIEEAEDGVIALEKIQQTIPDLILTDLVMPKLDGFELTRRLRQDENQQIRTLPIIAVSASVFSGDQYLSSEAGCNAFLPKPVHLEELLACLQHYLNLVWIYEQHTEITLQSFNVQPLQVPLESLLQQLTPEQADTLFNLAMLGDVQHLIKYATDLGKYDNHLLPFMERICELARNFEVEEICALVHPHPTDLHS